MLSVITAGCSQPSKREQDAEQALARLAKLGIDLGAITEQLLADGITAFTHSLDELLASLKQKRSTLLESQAAQKGEIRVLALRDMRRD